MKHNYLEKILNAHVYDVACETPLEKAHKLSTRLHNSVFLKREDLQSVFSFKLRGAYNKLYQLSKTTKLKRVIAASAGNHAQGLALAAQKMGVKAIIVMPKTTPQIKVDSVRNLGATARLHGDNYDEANELAQSISEQDNIPFIHPYDDPDVIAGQGTIAAELLRQQLGGIDAIFVPVGGGGLIAGIAAYVKALKPSIKVIGVEPVDAACLKAALVAGRRVKLDQVGIFVESVAVKQVGKEPFRIAKQCVDDVILVSTDEVCAAIKDIFDDTRSIAEPGGALAVAAIKSYVEHTSVLNQNLVAIVSGANMNFDRLRHVSERSEIGEHREMLFGVEIPEKPGSFRKLIAALGKRSVTEFNYRYAANDKAHVFVGLELSKGVERDNFMSSLQNKGYQFTDLTENEMAKLHIRYMVGGRVHSLEDEHLFRFEFPERPGALSDFLNSIHHREWNISLFHYRNHGSDFGRVLVGIQLPEKQIGQLKKSFDQLGFPYWDESDNPAYRMFLR